jgi:sporulation protein YabP
LEIHGLTLTNCEVLEASGVTFVSSFDDCEVILDTTHGPLFIKGEDLHINLLNLEEGKVVVVGRISLLEYKMSGKKLKSKGKNLFNKMMR